MPNIRSANRRHQRAIVTQIARAKAAAHAAAVKADADAKPAV